MQNNKHVSVSSSADLFAHVPALGSLLAREREQSRPARNTAIMQKNKRVSVSSSADLFAHVPALGSLLARQREQSRPARKTATTKDDEQKALKPRATLQNASIKPNSTATLALDLFPSVPGSRSCFSMPQTRRQAKSTRPEKLALQRKPTTTTTEPTDSTAALFAAVPGLGCVSAPQPSRPMRLNNNRSSKLAKKWSSTKPNKSAAALFSYVPGLGCVTVPRSVKASYETAPSTTKQL
ncbi:hypothetical protein HDU89_007680 [Geranomyces variabilis]|nr:hypothetical protein HDU89_007680 [Geranomyces variabilis]